MFSRYLSRQCYFNYRSINIIIKEGLECAGKTNSWHAHQRSPGSQQWLSQPMYLISTTSSQLPSSMTCFGYPLFSKSLKKGAEDLICSSIDWFSYPQTIGQPHNGNTYEVPITRTSCPSTLCHKPLPSYYIYLFTASPGYHTHEVPYADKMLLNITEAHSEQPNAIRHRSGLAAPHPLLAAFLIYLSWSKILKMIFLPPPRVQIIPFIYQHWP